MTAIAVAARRTLVPLGAALLAIFVGAETRPPAVTHPADRCGVLRPARLRRRSPVAGTDGRGDAPAAPVSRLRTAAAPRVHGLAVDRPTPSRRTRRRRADPRPSLRVRASRAREETAVSKLMLVVLVLTLLQVAKPPRRWTRRRPRRAAVHGRAAGLVLPRARAHDAARDARDLRRTRRHRLLRRRLRPQPDLERHARVGSGVGSADGVRGAQRRRRHPRVRDVLQCRRVRLLPRYRDRRLDCVRACADTRTFFRPSLCLPWLCSTSRAAASS